MTDAKTTTITATYRDIGHEFNGFPILFRHYFKQGAIHIRVDDNFARANGFESLEEIYKIDPAMRMVEWVDAELFGQGIIAAVIPGNDQQSIIN